MLGLNFVAHSKFKSYSKNVCLSDLTDRLEENLNSFTRKKMIIPTSTEPPQLLTIIVTVAIDLLNRKSDFCSGSSYRSVIC